MDFSFILNEFHVAQAGCLMPGEREGEGAGGSKGEKQGGGAVEYALPPARVQLMQLGLIVIKWQVKCARQEQ